MKLKAVSGLMFALAAGLLCAGAATAETVTVKLSGVKAGGGEMLVSLQTQDEFLQPKGHFGARAMTPAKGGDMTLTIKDVPPGRYSVSALHDVDGDHAMKMSASGMPAEGWAMNNGTLLLGPPTWDDVNFEVGAKPVTITEPMTYFPN